jgi:prephenate dehydrogenase
MKIGIVGLGLMGGSLALALRKNAPWITKIEGFDSNTQHCIEAIDLNIVDSIVTFDAIFKNNDIVFLAIPVEGIISILKNIDISEINLNVTIIDLGSTKEEIVKAVPSIIRENFIASHPMTGTEKSGPTASFDSLYEEKVVVLCDLESSGKKQQYIAHKIFSALAMKIIYMNAHEHDKHVAWISHLPHIISYSLANSVLAQEDPKSILDLSAGGFRDMSRLAKSSPTMWNDIFKQNRENLLKSINFFSNELKKLEEKVQNEDWDSLHKEMENANKLHEIL